MAEKQSECTDCIRTTTDHTANVPFVPKLLKNIYSGSQYILLASLRSNDAHRGHRLVNGAGHDGLHICAHIKSKGDDNT